MSKKKKRTGIKIIIASVLAFAVVIIAALSGIIAPHNPNATNALLMRKAPTAEYIFGTDNLGRCVFSRVLEGSRITLAATFLLVAISFVIGILIGMLCGYYGGMLDTIMMRIADLMLAFPQMVVAIAVAGILGGGLLGAMLALGITMWTGFARLARSHTLSIKNEPYITAAKLNGKNGLQIIFGHIMPNIIENVLVNALTQIGTTMIGLSGLSFLGLGVTAPQAEWGSMISEGRAYLQLAPWVVIFPAIAMIITIIIFNYLGDVVMEFRRMD